MFDRERAAADLKANLNPRRYEHSLRVAKKAVELAELYGADKYKAELAGLFHDFCKYLTKEEFIRISEALGVTEPIFYIVPELIHGHAAAYILKRDYGLDDEEVLSAISNHTFGAEKLPLLDKIVYLADAIEEGRTYPGVEEIREAAKYDLDLAIMFFVKDNIKYLVDSHFKMHMNAILMYNEGVDLLRLFEEVDRDFERYKELKPSI